MDGGGGSLADRRPLWWAGTRGTSAPPRRALAGGERGRTCEIARSSKPRFSRIHPRVTAQKIENDGPHRDLTRMSEHRLEHAEEIEVDQDEDDEHRRADDEERPLHQPAMKGSQIIAVEQAQDED